MKMCWLLLLLVATNLQAQTYKAITIVLDNSVHSQMLEKELTRDWTKAHPDVKLTWEQHLERIQVGLEMREIQQSLQFQLVRDFEVRQYLNLPAYRFDKYDEWTPFDKRAFSTTTVPLKTVKGLVDLYNHDARRAEWEEMCDRVTTTNEQLNKAATDHFHTWAGNTFKTYDPKTRTIILSNHDKVYMSRYWRDYLPLPPYPKKATLPYWTDEEKAKQIELEEREGM